MHAIHRLVSGLALGFSILLAAVLGLMSLRRSKPHAISPPASSTGMGRVRRVLDVVCATALASAMAWAVASDDRRAWMAKR